MNWKLILPDKAVHNCSQFVTKQNRNEQLQGLPDAMFMHLCNILIKSYPQKTGKNQTWHQV